MGEAYDVERLKGLLVEAGFTLLQADYLDQDYDPQREGWRIHDMPADKPAAYHICDGLEKEAAQAFVAAVNALPALLARIAELEEALGAIHAARMRRDGTDPGYGWNITQLNAAVNASLPLIGREAPQIDARTANVAEAAERAARTMGCTFAARATLERAQAEGEGNG